MRKLILVLACVIIAGAAIANADEKLVDLVKKVKPSVVLIETFDKDNKPIAQGSGFFIDNKGSLITNYHVIEGACSAAIKTSAGKVYLVQGIVAKDTEADIVKLVVNLPDTNMTFLNLSVNVPSEGEDIYVIGNPLGLESTVSSGIVSAVRDVPAFGGKTLQITAPISHGSSGSPVINSKGEVIGIAARSKTGGQNLNFAIPSDKIIALKETPKTSLFESYKTLTDYDKGFMELRQENWSAALTYFQKETTKNPQNADARFFVGYCYNKLGRYQDAVEALKQVIKINPNYVEAYSGLGVVYGKLGLWREAMVAYKQVIRLNPNYDLVYYNIGNAYYNLGIQQEAIDASRIKPALVNANYRYKEAVVAYWRAIGIKPDYAEAHFGLGNAYYKLGSYEDAIEVYKRAIKRKQDYAEAHCGLGLTYLITGDKGSALEEYKILKTLDAELANKLFNLIYK